MEKTEMGEIKFYDKNGKKFTVVVGLDQERNVFSKIYDTSELKKFLGYGTNIGFGSNSKVFLFHGGKEHARIENLKSIKADMTAYALLVASGMMKPLMSDIVFEKDEEKTARVTEAKRENLIYEAKEVADSILSGYSCNDEFVIYAKDKLEYHFYFYEKSASFIRTMFYLKKDGICGDSEVLMAILGKKDSCEYNIAVGVNGKTVPLDLNDVIKTVSDPKVHKKLVDECYLYGTLKDRL